MTRYRVYYNGHRYSDYSDTPHSLTRIIEADTPEDAMQAVHDLDVVNGPRRRTYIGLVHCAYPVDTDPIAR